MTLFDFVIVQQCLDNAFVSSLGHGQAHIVAGRWQTLDPSKMCCCSLSSPLLLPFWPLNWNWKRQCSAPFFQVCLPLLFQCEITHVHEYSHAQISHKQLYLQGRSEAATAILTYVLSCAGAACPLRPNQLNVKNTALSHRWQQYLMTLRQRSNIHTDCINTKPKRGGGIGILLLWWLLQFLWLLLVYAAYWKNVTIPKKWLSDVLLMGDAQAYSERMTPQLGPRRLNVNIPRQDK